MAGEVLISVAAETILCKLASIVIEEIGLASSSENDINHLRDKSQIILALLRDAQKGRVKGEAVILWLKNMKVAVYEVDDVFDGLAFDMLTKNKISNFFFRFKMAHKVRDLNVTLDRVVQQGRDLGLNQALHRAIESSIESSTDQREFWQTHPFVNDLKVLGREKDKSKVLKMLLKPESEENLSVVAIIGLAGLGKTTLAQLIYKDEEVTRYFDEIIWVCVSNDFNVTRLLKEMVDYLNMSSIGETSNTAVLIRKLNEKLSRKKYLLVLDDVWNTDSRKWELLMNSLFGIGGDQLSKILVTTRSDMVVSTMQTPYTLHLEGLSEKDSWSLFRQKAFAIGGAKETAFVTDVGKRLIKRCKGVPLAISTLGALMQSKREYEWSSIEQSDLWDLSSDESGIMSALRLSFNNFPSSYLKQCFAYCSIFPKDVEFQKDDLIQLWIAQGFIQSSQSMEDTGNDYFKILLWNSFFQDVEMDKYGNIIACKMHDLVHDLAQSISKSECFVMDADQVNNDDIVVRHLNLLTNKGTLPKIPKENVVKLRTLFLTKDVPGSFFVNFKCLRALNFEGAYIEELPKSIGKLKNLRYLNVSNTKIKEFPTSIVKLYNLQTIRLMGCYQFGELPKEFASLISLTHFCYDARYGNLMHQMPVEMGRLTCLQTLPCFVVGHDKGYKIEELGSLNRLRGELHVRNLELVKSKNEAKKANLLMKTNLFKLRLTWSSGRNGGNTDEDVLEGLQPPTYLGSLSIEEFDGRNFPSWMITNNGNSLLPDSLVEIKLKNCRKCETIPTLGELPFLKFLHISGMDNLKRIGREFYSSNNICGGASSSYSAESKRITLFPALKTLKLKRMSNLVEWTEAATTVELEGSIVVVFPHLEDLTIEECEQLKTAPTHFPFLKELRIEKIKSRDLIEKISSQLTTLTSLRIYNILELTSLPEELLQNNKNLIDIYIGDCQMLTCFSPDDVGLQTLVSLQKLTIAVCPKLSSIPNIHGLTSLRSLGIWDCDGITNLPIGLGSCTSLEELRVWYCPNLISVTEEDLRELKSLSSLSINRCAKLKGGLPLEGFLHCLTRLRWLTIGGLSDELDSFPFNINQEQPLQHIKTLNLYGWPKLKSLPHQLQHLTALQALYIWEFDGVETLPDWLGNLSSLQELHIRKCNYLKYLPSVEAMRRLINLQKLYVTDCPLLKDGCNKESGLEWSKICHIPFILIDYCKIQDLTKCDEVDATNKL